MGLLGHRENPALRKNQRTDFWSRGDSHPATFKHSGAYVFLSQRGTSASRVAGYCVCKLSKFMTVQQLKNLLTVIIRQVWVLS